MLISNINRSNEFLVAVPNRNLSYLRDLGDLPLRLPLARQHRSDVACCRCDSCWTAPRRKFEFFCRRENLVGDLLDFARHRQLVGELRYVLAWTSAVGWSS